MVRRTIVPNPQEDAALILIEALHEAGVSERDANEPRVNLLANLWIRQLISRSQFVRECRYLYAGGAKPFFAL